MATKDDVEFARYTFKRALEEIRDLSGRGTELISLYVPPERQISDVMAYLRNEYSQSSNIKSKTTKKNVMGAIESIMSRLKTYREPPENGVVFFVGHIPTSGDQTTMIAHVLEPPEPLITYMYRCDNRFYTEPLEDMLVEKRSYGLVVIDRSEATIGLLRGKRVTLIRNIQSRVMGKHRQGGQSSVRFERLIEESVHNYFKKVAEIAGEAFLSEEELMGIIIGGPGSTKRNFAEKDYLHHDLKKKVLDLLDTGYTDETGLRELVQNAEQMLQDIDLVKEKKLVQKFLQEVRKSDGGLATYGYREVLNALSMGAVETILASEVLREELAVLNCTSCGVQDKRLVKGENQPKCTHCGADMSEEERKDLVSEVHDLASETGTRIAIVSGDTEEGEILMRAFSGLAALLRYQVRSNG